MPKIRWEHPKEKIGTRAYVEKWAGTFEKTMKRNAGKGEFVKPRLGNVAKELAFSKAVTKCLREGVLDEFFSPIQKKVLELTAGGSTMGKDDVCFLIWAHFKGVTQRHQRLSELKLGSHSC